MARAARAVIQSPRLSRQVYDLIREEIKSGELGPGQRLLEAELASRYKVSRTPVREALFQLSREGYLINGARGFTIPAVSPAGLLHGLEVRLLLDPELVRRAATAGAEASQSLMGSLYLLSFALTGNSRCPERRPAENHLL